MVAHEGSSLSCCYGQACDALSAFRILRDLFSDVTASPLEATPHCPTKLRSLADHLARAPCSPPELAISPCAPRTTAEPSLPLANEEHYPVVPLGQPPELAGPSLAQRRWFWAFKRIILLRRQDAYPRTLPFPRKVLGIDPAAPPQPRTWWPRLRFDRETSAVLFAQCKKEGVSPSTAMSAVS